MKPRHRNERAGAIYHVMARGVDRRHIFVDHEDYEAYTDLLGMVCNRQGWHLLCYCLMPNHVHLVIETPETNLANGMQLLHSCHARAFNRRHDRTGHLFEAPYRSPMITSDGKLVRTVGYVVVNPVTARLCARASDWPWGSHRRPRPPWVAHARLVGELERITGLACYDELIASHERSCFEQIGGSRQ